MKPNQTWTQSLLAATLIAAAGLFTGCQTHNHTHAAHHGAAASVPLTKETQAAMTPAQALQRLKDGNQRFVEGHLLARDFAAERQATAAGQYPFAVVLSCLDSRASSELVFDQGLGDLFSARVAGNVLSEDMIGSMEFACQLAGAKLIVVVGHTRCGAVRGACAGAELGHLTGLLSKIKPAVDAVPVQGTDPAAKTSDAHVDAVAKENVKMVLEQIRRQSPILADMIQSGKIGLAGGMHDLATGQVTFLN
jgi:carbonic anhydrase